MANPGPAITISAHPQNMTSVQTIRLLFVQKGLSVSAVGGVVLPIINSTAFSVKDVVIANASANVSAAVIAITTGPSGTGTGIFSGTLTTSISNGVVADNAPTTTNSQTAQNLYVQVTTASANAGTVDLYIYGYDFS